MSPGGLTIAPTDDTELHVSIQTLLDALDDVHDGLRQLAANGASFNLFCYVGSYDLEHCAILGPGLLQRVAELHAELWLDIYGDDL